MKKIFIIAAALLTLSTGAVFSVSAANTATTIRGDADGNGKVNINDVTAIQRHCAQLETLTEKKQTLAADVDGNGRITIDDATFIQEYLAEFENTYDILGVIYYNPYELPVIIDDD